MIRRDIMDQLTHKIERFSSDSLFTISLAFVIGGLFGIIAIGDIFRTFVLKIAHGPSLFGLSVSTILGCTVAFFITHLLLWNRSPKGHQKEVLFYLFINLLVVYSILPYLIEQYNVLPSGLTGVYAGIPLLALLFFYKQLYKFFKESNGYSSLVKFIITSLLLIINRSIIHISFSKYSGFLAPVYALDTSIYNQWVISILEWTFLIILPGLIIFYLVFMKSLKHLLAKESPNV